MRTILRERELRSLIRAAVGRAVGLREAEERSAYTGGSRTYEVNNARDLEALLMDDGYSVGKGEFVDLTYISQTELNKYFNRDGYTDSAGNFFSVDDIEQKGRALGKKHLNDIFDSDKFKARDFRRSKNGVACECALLVVSSMKVNWAAMTYGANKDERRQAIRDAGESVIDQYTRLSRDFDKRFKKYCEKYPERADELETMRETGTLDRETIVDIYDEDLGSWGGRWNKESKFLSRHENGNPALRLTHSPAQYREQRTRYYMVRNGELSEIGREEYFTLRRMFGKKQSVSRETTSTELDDLLAAIAGECIFRNRLLSSVLKLSCTLRAKDGTKNKYTYVNNEIDVPGMDRPVRYEEFENAVMAESRLSRDRRVRKLAEAVVKDVKRRFGRRGAR